MFRKLFYGGAIALTTATLGYAQAPGERNELSPAAQAELDGFNKPPLPLAGVNIPTDVDAPGNGEVLISGPLHEAYAEQFTNQPRPGFIISKEPPAPVDEIPPDYRPEGFDIVWIPGYWGWDPERDNFVWITGIWRQAPPDRNWVPGYWAQVTDGFQWISGFWTQTAASEIEYLPKPPDPIEAQPSSEAPSANHFWIPGQWSYNNNNYQWRAGYWSEGYEDWVWVPDRYVWTPGGYIYRTGYWDYLLADRGTIFCPVYWSNPTPNYRFQPQYVVNSGPGLLANLFVNPAYNHYYYGNYYGNQFTSRNIYPWVTFTQQSRLYDPLYGYYRTQYRDTAYLDRITRLHNYYAANPSYQPARTLSAQLANIGVNGAVGNNITNVNNVDNSIFQAVRLTNLINNQELPNQLVRVADREREALQTGLNPARELRQLRARMERQQVTGTTQDGNSIARAGGAQSDESGARSANRWRLPESKAGTRLGSIAVTPGNVTPNVDASQPNAGNNNRGNADRGNPGRNDGNRDTARTDGNRDTARTDGNRDTARNDNDRDRPRTDGNSNVARGDGNPANNTRDDRPGSDRPGSDRPGSDRPGNSSERDRTGNRDDRPGNRPDGTRAQPETNSPNNPFGTSGLPGVTRPEIDKPSADKTGADKPGAGTDKTGADRPGADRPGADRPGADRPGADRPGTNRPDTGVRPGADRGNNSRPNGIAPGEPNPSTPGASAPGRNVPGANGARPNGAGQTGSPTGSSPSAGGNDVQDDIRAMRDLSRREAERRRAAGSTPRSLPQVPQARGNQPAVNAPGRSNPGAANPAAPTPGAANPGAVTPGGNRGAGVNPGRATPGAANPGAANPGRANPGAANPAGANPAGARPGGNSPAATPGANPAANPGARSSQRPIIPTPANNANPGRGGNKPVAANPGRGKPNEGGGKGKDK